MSTNKLAEAVVRFKQGDIAGAQRLCNHILRRESANAGALHLLGVTHLSTGDPGQAVAALRRARIYAPGDAAISENLGLAHLAAGEAQAAEQIFRTLIDAGATHGLLRMRLGLALQQQGRVDEAETALRRALEEAPTESDAYINLSNVLAAQDRVVEAIAVVTTALAQWPQHRDVLYNRAVLLQRLRRFDEALAAYAAVLQVDPAHIEARNNCGIVLESMGNLEQAETCYRKVLTHDPRHVHALSNLGKVLRAQGRLEDAAHSCLRALDIDAYFVDALLNLAGVRAEQGAYDEALRCYRRALALAPNDGEANVSYGMLCLGLGQFEAGWRHCQWRPQRKQALTTGTPFDSNLPANASGKRILLIGEQGIGDELFFLRYATIFQQRGARLLGFCDSKIAGPLRRAGLFERIETHGNALPDCDLRFMVGDLPWVLGNAETGWDMLPPPLRLSALEDRVSAMRARLAALGPAPYIGLTWRADTPPEEQVGRVDRALFKQAPIAQLTEAIGKVSGTLIAVQRRPRAGEMDAISLALQRDVHDFSSVNDDLEDMLALLALLQEYVGVSNTNMHLRAGLGGSARVLAPNPPDWRWMTAGETSPWFPRFKVYRQLPEGDWTAALHALADDLALEAGG